MRETAKALAAFNDYYAMGSNRSLKGLLAKYKRRRKNYPTKSLNTLWGWSTNHNWDKRCKAREVEMWETLTDALQDERKVILNSGLAVDTERVKALNDLAQELIAQAPENMYLREPRIIGKGEDAEVVWVLKFNEGQYRQIGNMVGDIAKETGGRREQVEHKHDVSDIPPIIIRYATDEEMEADQDDQEA